MKHLSLLFLILSGWIYNPSSPQTILLQKDIPLQAQIIKGGNIYIVSDTFDLQNDTLYMPPDCVLSFDGGCIRNGAIAGNKTEIRSKKVQIFEGVTITGDFNNKVVYSEWIPLHEGGTDNKDTFNNIMAMACSDTYTDVYLQEGIYYASAGSHGDGIKIPSNTYVHNNASICALPTSKEKYDIITIRDVENVVFDGGTIIGDIDTHLGNTGEWGYGIGLTGARNAVVKNVNISKCWGDGINVQALYSDYLNKTTDGHCYNIFIDNVICDDNRRQGMSIEGCIGIKVLNSKFINTGKTKATLPMSGIDIEPWFDTELVCDVTISKCQFYNNVGGNLIAPLTKKQWEHKGCKGYVIENNVFDDDPVRFNRTRDLTFRNNTVGSEHGLLEFNQYDDISIISNVINGNVGIYTESESQDGCFNKNIVHSGERLPLALEEISDNEIHGCIVLREDMDCVVRNNKIFSTDVAGDYSFICDNTHLTMYDNTIEMSKPMIFRYKSHVKVYRNIFKVIEDITPACMILQTARNPQFAEDGIIRNNIMSGRGKLTVNYSAKGIYKLDDNLIID